MGLGIEIYKPYLRAGMEREIKEVSEGLKQKDIIYNEMKQDMLKIYDKVFSNLDRLKNNVIKFIDDNPDFDSQILHLRNNRNNRRNNNNDRGDDDDYDDRGNGGDNGGDNGGFGGGGEDFNDDNDDDENNNGNKRKRRKRKQNNNYKKDNYKKNKQKNNTNSNNTRINKNINDNNNIKRNNSDLSNNGYIRYCPLCNNPMRLQQNRASGTYFLGCTRYPDCKKSLNIGNPTSCELSDRQCTNCNGKLYSMKTGNQSNFTCLGNCLNDNQNNFSNNNNNFNNNNKKKYTKKKGWKKNNYHKKSNGNNNDFDDLDEE